MPIEWGLDCKECPAQNMDCNRQFCSISHITWFCSIYHITCFYPLYLFIITFILACKYHDYANFVLTKVWKQTWIAGSQFRQLLYYKLVENNQCKQWKDKLSMVLLRQLGRWWCVIKASVFPSGLLATFQPWCQMALEVMEGQWKHVPQTSPSL